jgi:hypothetical protein
MHVYTIYSCMLVSDIQYTTETIGKADEHKQSESLFRTHSLNGDDINVRLNNCAL